MKELKSQLASALLVIVTVAAVICAAINLQQQQRYVLPDDGVTWVDRGQPDDVQVTALHVDADSAGARAGLRRGDVLLRINGGEIESELAVPQVLIRLKAWSKAEYLIERRGVEVKVPIIIGERLVDTTLYYEYLVGLAYLIIGVFVFFRRRTAPRAVHFSVLCLASFVLSTFHYTGKLNDFDKVIYWGNVIAGLLAPTIFLHFCLIFPEGRRWVRGWRTWLVYAPAILLALMFLGVGTGRIHVAAPLVELRWFLDRLWLPFFSFAYLAGAFVLHLRRRHTDDPVVRQQVKWLRNGAFFGVLPFTLFYVVPYTLGAVPGPTMKIAVLSLTLIPLTWAYSIVRYRLMDVDIIFQQGYAYTLATLAVLGTFYGFVFSIGKVDELNPSAILGLILLGAFVFQPVRRWVQENLDRYLFYRDRYDYRLTLIEFARELSAETDLERMLTSVSDRLLRTLSIQHVAVFLCDESPEGKPKFHLRKRAGLAPNPLPGPLDLSFLSTEPGKNYLFFERTRHAIDVISRELPPTVRHTIGDLDLTYYIPCSVRGRTIAYLGISRTDKGDFLTSDDLELVLTLANYVGIAVENARLYSSLARKVEQYERLKEFNENIVESINVGILAADLADRVESWNNQLERLTGITRDEAVGRRLQELFPAELMERFDRVRGETGVHNIYKFGYRPISASDERTLNLAIAPLVSREQEQIGRLIIFDDITDRSELEKQLVQADKLSSIGLLAAGVAHEVNTPLAVISTYAQMLAKQVNGDDTKSKLLEKIARQTFRASEIVNSLLNFSRTSTTAFEEVDLNRTIRETLTLIEHQLAKSGVRVEGHYSEHLPAIKGNAGKLQQVFLNLFLNARDAMEQGGVLTVATSRGEGVVRIEVTDTGKGIPSEHLARIFDPFFTTKAARKGTGLGLSVTYGIVQEHGGTIEVTSEVGLGTRFRLEFPIARRIGVARPETAQAAASPVNA